MTDQPIGQPPDQDRQQPPAEQPPGTGIQDIPVPGGGGRLNVVGPAGDSGRPPRVPDGRPGIDLSDRATGRPSDPRVREQVAGLLDAASPGLGPIVRGQQERLHGSPDQPVGAAERDAIRQAGVDAFKNLYQPSTGEPNPIRPDARPAPPADRSGEQPAPSDQRPAASGPSDQDQPGSPADGPGEGDRLAHPESGIGFRQGEAAVEPSELRRFIDGLSEADRQALQDGTTALRVTAHASRTGDAAANLALTAQRAENVLLALTERFPELANRMNVGVADGEAMARRAGAADGVDVAEHRRVDIAVERAEPPGPAGRSHRPGDQTGADRKQEQLIRDAGRLVEAARAEAAMRPIVDRIVADAYRELPPKEWKHDPGRILDDLLDLDPKAAGSKFLRGLGGAMDALDLGTYHSYLSGAFLPSFLNELERQSTGTAGTRPSTLVPGRTENATYQRLGVQAALGVWNRTPESERPQVIQLFQADRGNPGRGPDGPGPRSVYQLAIQKVWDDMRNRWQPGPG